MRAIEELESMGYRMEVDGHAVRFCYQGKGRPDAEAAARLVEILEANEPEAVRFLTWREMERIFTSALSAVRETYVPGLLDRLEDEFPELSAGLATAEDALETTWAAVRQGRATLEDFRRAVDSWKDTLVSYGYVARFLGIALGRLGLAWK